MVSQSTHDAPPPAACPVVKAHHHGLLSALPCVECTANNFRLPGAPLCGYCHATGSCVEVTAHNALAGPCPEPDDDAPPYDGPVAPAQDYSLGLDGECDCRPDVWTDCRSCASHPRCDWVAEGTEKRTWKFRLFGSTTITHVQEVSLDGTCRRALEDERTTYELTNDAGDALVTLAVEPRPREVYWGQCSVSGGPSRVLLVGGGVLLLVGLGAGVLLRSLRRACCGSRDARGRGPASEDTPLVGEHGREMQPVV